MIYYLNEDPKVTPIKVQPGIHYFMGGIDVDEGHHTNIRSLYAAGECCDLYHGANRLGGNSLLGALYGGKKAADTLMGEISGYVQAEYESGDDEIKDAEAGIIKEISGILLGALGIVRCGEDLKNAIDKTDALLRDENYKNARKRLLFGKAMLMSALYRRESRGAHYRSDYPEKDEAFRRIQRAVLKDQNPEIIPVDIPRKRD